ncbi:uncharacterized protein BJX67DRAFT_368782 [Aspergillus lucknowensis]|uniref:mRNA stability protein n=1 Tax=Aspergillus lucknowensis TaxID=176173 RepID=A0ABR4L8K9_9EURO
MDAKKDKEAPAHLLSERDKHILSIYGRVPSGGMLGQQAKKRVYFDSGDFALSAAHGTTDDGAIQTGISHPVRESISHPYAPIPNTSNANNDANEGFHDKYSRAEFVDSPLGRRPNPEEEDTSDSKDQNRLS